MSGKEMVIATWTLIFVCLSPLIATLAEHREYVKYLKEREKKK